MLLLLTIPMAHSQIVEQPTLSPLAMDLAKQYGIDLAKSYKGSLVAQALAIQLQEAEKEIAPRLEESWNLGYKAATEEWKPRALVAESELGVARIAIGRYKDALDAAEKKHVFTVVLLSVTSAVFCGLAIVF